MDDRRALWNLQQNLLKSILLKPSQFDEAIKVCLEQHAMVHSAEMSHINTLTFEDELWEGLDEATFRAMPTEKDETIAWSLWHLTRIEDITVNLLVDGNAQIINCDHWLAKMNVKVCDTGNAMTDQEILDFSSDVDMNELRNYRIAVGRKTREIITGFQPADLKRKMQPDRLQRILDEGAVLNVSGANWLIDFWSRKNGAGILLMPITRHQIVHLNEALRLKKKIQSLRSQITNKVAASSTRVPG